MAFQVTNFFFATASGFCYPCPTVVNLGDDLHDALQSAWTLPAGAVFDESTARKIAISPNLSPLLKHALTVANIHSTLKLHEETHTVDVELTLVRKPL